MDKPDYKPHEKSMPLGYLAILTGDIPRWIQYIIENRLVDFQTYPQNHPKSTNELVGMFDENMAADGKTLKALKDEDLSQEFQLKNGEQLFTTMICPLPDIPLALLLADKSNNRTRIAQLKRTRPWATSCATLQPKVSAG